MSLCWAALTAILSRVQPVSRRLDTPAPWSESRTPGCCHPIIPLNNCRTRETTNRGVCALATRALQLLLGPWDSTHHTCQIF